MPSTPPFVLVASESSIARGFVEVILRAGDLETRPVFSPEQALAALRPEGAGARASAVLLIDASLLGRAEPHEHDWDRLVRAHPELPVVCLKLAGRDRAPESIADRVRAHVDAMNPRGLVATVRSAARSRPLSVRPRRADAEERSAR